MKDVGGWCGGAEVNIVSVVFYLLDISFIGVYYI